jgi:hypothetical protein
LHLRQRLPAIDAAPAGVQKQDIQALRQENVELRSQLTALASELASLRGRIGRSSRSSSEPPSSEGPGFQSPERRKGSGRKRGGTLFEGEEPEPLRHQVIEIPPIPPLVIEHRLHRRMWT